jgi:hypothetical protein
MSEPIFDVPIEMYFAMFQYLDICEILSFVSTCKAAYSIVDDSFWLFLARRYYPKLLLNKPRDVSVKDYFKGLVEFDEYVEMNLIDNGTEDEIRKNLGVYNKGYPGICEDIHFVDFCNKVDIFVTYDGECGEILVEPQGTYITALNNDVYYLPRTQGQDLTDVVNELCSIDMRHSNDEELESYREYLESVAVSTEDWEFRNFKELFGYKRPVKPFRVCNLKKKGHKLKELAKFRDLGLINLFKKFKLSDIRDDLCVFLAGL